MIDTPSPLWLEIAEDIFDACDHRLSIDDYKRACRLKPARMGMDTHSRMRVLQQMLQESLIQILDGRLALGHADDSEWLMSQLMEGERAIWEFADRHFIGAKSVKFNDERIKQIGLAGERWLVNQYLSILPEDRAPLVEHVSLVNDAAGFDIKSPRIRDSNVLAHIEAKTSVRPGNYFEFFLSRNEFEVGCRDPAWVLVLVTKNEGDHRVYGHMFADQLEALVPSDVSPDCKWSSAKFRVDRRAVFPDLP